MKRKVYRLRERTVLEKPNEETNLIIVIFYLVRIYPEGYSIADNKSKQKSERTLEKIIERARGAKKDPTRRASSKTENALDSRTHSQHSTSSIWHGVFDSPESNVALLFGADASCRIRTVHLLLGISILNIC